MAVEVPDIALFTQVTNIFEKPAVSIFRVVKEDRAVRKKLLHCTGNEWVSPNQVYSIGVQIYHLNNIKHTQSRRD
jgi:hypothetical protein